MHIEYDINKNKCVIESNDWLTVMALGRILFINFLIVVQFLVIGIQACHLMLYFEQ